MLGSEILDQLVTPAVFVAFGSRVVGRRWAATADDETARTGERLFPVEPDDDRGRPT